MVMELSDSTRGVNLTLGSIYHQLIELASIDRALLNQISAVNSESIMTKITRIFSVLF